MLLLLFFHTPWAGILHITGRGMNAGKPPAVTQSPHHTPPAVVVVGTKKEKKEEEEKKKQIDIE